MSENDPYAELLALCAEGDQRAFARLYKQASPRLLASAIRLLRTRQLAEEVLQEGFVKIWHKAGTFDSSKASAMTWMTTIIRNRALDVLRSQKSRPQESEYEFESLEFEAEGLSPGDLAGLDWSARRVSNCMSGLQDKQRQSILMAYYYGFTHEEIAEKLDAPLGTVKAWVRRGIQRLRECLG